MIKNLVVKLISLFKLEIFKPEKNVSDEKLLPLLRSQIHVLEKRVIEREVDFLKMMHARAYYFEARDREILSQDEIDWCENVLFGKNKREQRIKSSKVNASGDITSIIKERRSVRVWKESDIDKDVFKNLIEAAKWAPSSCNRQPWHFIVISDKEKLNLLYQAKGQKFLKNAPYCIMVLVNQDAWSSKEAYDYFSGLDSGAAIQNLLLKAEDLGLGACWVNWSPKEITKENSEKVKKVFNIPGHYNIISIIPIGRYEDKPFPPARKNTDDFLSWDAFNG